MLGIIGKKIGMIRTFDDNGTSIPVTVIKAGPCTVTYQKKEDSHGYNALQLGFKIVNENKINKPLKGHFKKNNLKCFKILKEFRVDNKIMPKYKIGSTVSSDIFKKDEMVDVSGTSKGRGFSGVMKRHNFKGKNRTHGTHEIFRGGGAIGQCATPSRVFTGKKMAGHMGNETVTVKNLKVIKVDAKQDLILIKGAIPGHRNSIVTIKKINR